MRGCVIIARYIDADVLYQKTEELEKQAREASRQAITEPTQEKWNTILAERSAFKYDITQMPTIDAVPVVRCKDCKQYKTIFTWNGNEYKSCELNPHGDGDWFCADGERKDDEHTD